MKLLKKLFKDEDAKCVNPVYTTFKGGYDSGWKTDGKVYPGEPYQDYWSYVFLWGNLRLVYDRLCMKEGWIKISLHGYNNGYTYTPVKLHLPDFHWHIAVNTKFPFIKFGFERVWALVKAD